MPAPSPTSDVVPLHRRAARSLSRLPLAAIAFVLVAAVQSTYAAVRGVICSPDSCTYQAWADALIRLHFDVPAFVHATTSDYPPLLYVVWVLVVAAMRLALGDDWPTGVVVLNVLASAAAGALLVRLAQRLTGSRAAAAFALVLYLVSFDLTDWSRYALSDPTYLLLTLLAFVLAAHTLLGGRPRGAAAAIAMLPVLTFYRPTFIAMLPPLLAAAWLGLAPRAAESLGSVRGARRALAVVVAGSLAGLAAFAVLMREPQRWPLHAGAVLVRFTAGHWRLGEVIWDRPALYRPPPHTRLDFLSLAAVRLAAFFRPVSPDLEPHQAAQNLFFFVSAYALALYGVIAALRRPAWLDTGRRIVILASASIVVVVSTFHAMLEVDEDWRYRLPVLPYLVLLAAVGVAAALRRRPTR